MSLISIIRYVILIASAIGLAACLQTPPPQPAPPPIPTVGEVDLNTATSDPQEYLLLDIGVEVFEVEISEQEALEFGEWIFTEIRENEAHYLPYILRNTLLASNQWGAARVLPTRDPSMDLTIQGTVLSSDGQRLTIWIEALDSTGRVWLQKEYADESLTDDYPISTRYTPGSPFDASKFIEPFQDIYDQ